MADGETVCHFPSCMCLCPSEETQSSMLKANLLTHGELNSNDSVVATTGCLLEHYAECIAKTGAMASLVHLEGFPQC